MRAVPSTKPSRRSILRGNEIVGQRAKRMRFYRAIVVFNGKELAMPCAGLNYALALKNFKSTPMPDGMTLKAIVPE